MPSLTLFYLCREHSWSWQASFQILTKFSVLQVKESNFSSDGLPWSDLWLIWHRAEDFLEFMIDKQFLARRTTWKNTTCGHRFRKRGYIFIYVQIWQSTCNRYSVVSIQPTTMRNICNFSCCMTHSHLISRNVSIWVLNVILLTLICSKISYFNIVFTANSC